jgi:hypothetical protein
MLVQTMEAGAQMIDDRAQGCEDLVDDVVSRSSPLSAMSHRTSSKSGL